MAPLGNTVGFVHRVEGNLDFLEQGDVVRLCEGLRRHVQQLGAAGEQVLADISYLLPGKGGIEEMRYALAARLKAAYGVHLILHQGDER